MGIKIINPSGNLSVNTVTNTDKTSFLKSYKSFFLRKGLLLLVLFILLIGAPVFANNTVVRVGLTDNKFQNVLKQQTIVYGTSECTICDKATGKALYK